MPKWLPMIKTVRNYHPIRSENGFFPEPFRNRAEATLAALKSRLALTPLSSATARGRPFPQQRWRLAMWRNFRSAPSFRRA